MCLKQHKISIPSIQLIVYGSYGTIAGKRIVVWFFIYCEYVKKLRELSIFFCGLLVLRAVIHFVYFKAQVYFPEENRWDCVYSGVNNMCSVDYEWHLLKGKLYWSSSRTWITNQPGKPWIFVSLEPLQTLDWSSSTLQQCCASLTELIALHSLVWSTPNKKMSRCVTSRL